MRFNYPKIFLCATYHKKFATYRIFYALGLKVPVVDTKGLKGMLKLLRGPFGEDICDLLLRFILSF